MSSFRKPIQVTRTEPGHYDSDTGIWVEGESVVFTTPMSIQPLAVDEMDALPEGRRNSRSVKIYSSSELFPAKQAMSESDTGRNPDIIYWLGSNYEVVGCNPYQMGVISHYKSYAVEVKAN
jgi:hypothetical protein